MSEGKEVQEGKIYAVLAYISILWVLPLLLKKDNKFAAFHGKQGMVIFLAEIVCVVAAFTPFLGAIGTIALYLLVFVSIWGIIQALAGKYTKIPIICDLADKINI